MKRFLRLLLVVVLALPSAGCFEAFKKKPYADEAAAEGRKPNMKDQSDDQTFQSFLGRLRTAVARRDLQIIASMMTPDFGYRWDTPPPGDNVFAYWDAHDTWSELELVLREKFVPFEDFMVAPAQFAADPSSFGGYRAGMAMVNGSWKFVYFVPAPAEAGQ